MNQCSAVKGNGEQCKRSAQPGAVLCWHHDPANAKVRKEVASAGGVGRAEMYRTCAESIVAIQNEIKDLIDRVLKGSIDKGKAAVAMQGFGVLRGFLEQERKQREYDELLPRLDALELAARREADARASDAEMPPLWAVPDDGTRLELPGGAVYE